VGLGGEGHTPEAFTGDFIQISKPSPPTHWKTNTNRHHCRVKSLCGLPSTSSKDTEGKKHMYINAGQQLKILILFNFIFYQCFVLAVLIFFLFCFCI
jgi:hypothetical protein